VRRILGTEIGDYLPALGALALTGFYLVLAYRYKPMVREFPAGVAWVMVGLLGLDLAARTQTRAGRALTRWLNPTTAAPEPRALWPQLAACLWVAGFAALLVLIGILSAVPVFVFAALTFRARCGLGTAIFGAAGVTFFVWVLFSLLLRLSLYPGLLFGGA
jgi:lipopolysaccharide export LptBFGC system permease protein LptF